MKTKTKIMDVTHEDLVTLLADAFYGSYFLTLVYDSNDYERLVDKKEDDCLEDKCARILLSGGSIEIGDRYAEDSDEYYGNLPHMWDDDFGAMFYTVTLKDIVKSLETILNNGGYDAKRVMELISDNGDLDQTDAEAIIQCIVFGEVIYG